MQHNEHTRQQTVKNYIPLGVILALIVISAGVTGDGSIDTFLLHGMTGFFLVFGGFKLIDIRGFAEGYATYDLLAMRWRCYGYIYPFIEIAFGMVMLAGFHPDWLLWTEVAVMIFSGIGVILAMRKQAEIQCVCLGTALNVPLTSVSVIENVSMATAAILVIL